MLILDEPTSMLTPKGVEELGAVMRRLRDQGVAVIFITHKLKEAYAFGDRISVLRLGRLVGEIAKERLAEMDEAAAMAAVIRLMFGSEAGHEDEAQALLGAAEAHGEADRIDRSVPPRLEVTGLTTAPFPGSAAAVDVSFKVWPGEVFGIAGVDGNGQKHLAEALAGQRALASGRIRLAGQEITQLDVPSRRDLGLRYITDERLGEGTVARQSVAANLVMKEIGRPPFWRHGVTQWERIFAAARETIAAHDIRTPSERTPVGRLSGGNIQKVLLARELGEEASLVIFNKPTYGLDLQNTRLARARIRAAAEAGLATLVVSTELDELIELADRIGVMYRGGLVGIVDNRPGAEERIGALMTGAAGR